MKLAEADFVILQVARFDYLKDYGTAVRTFERVVRDEPRARWVIVGDGADREMIEREVCQRNLAGSVRMLGERTDVGRLLAAADVALLTSVSEGFPLTLIEAMAARLPVVATRAGGVQEIVLAENTGLLVPVGDDAGLARAVLRLAADPNLRERMGEAGYERAQQNFSDARMFASYDELYEEMVG